MEGITECRLADILKFSGVPSAKEIVTTPFDEYKAGRQVAGDINIFESSRGPVIRYTNSKDWIRFVSFIVNRHLEGDKRKGNGVVLVIDCGYQFRRLFAGKDSILVVEFEDVLKVDGPLAGLDRHIELTIWSNVGLIEDYLNCIDVINLRFADGLLLGTSVLGVFRYV
ncbi:hypothetical protein PICMEDRAFT_73952 [Pichia membranifaciens NRRL Y-2026]|uniref:Uncharacterized protein n=1 Tax=Pichia membranifaciens NRRL Y-2026 TaxID=763406 RepID=A0A1E3NGC1_9ASCO|nr:hypothetical protein PICMEDRAFT_73952 [Pichia membranifaciens NRRL Y-2026]ODQ45174.1 hypothetical protein PICMEDRAFT_73952 [Pichia membranifaciens NRRL Y-2026]